MPEPNYRVGEIVVQRTSTGETRKVLVKQRSSNIKNGLPGFDGVSLGPQNKGMEVWGYDSQITCIENEDRSSEAASAPVVRAVRQLSSGTLSTFSNLTRYEEIDEFRETLAKNAERWVDMGVIEPDATWQDAWNLFTLCHRALNGY